jgi:hypothetical protein
MPDKIMSPKKISRNDPCPCGSGKKYKKCCLTNRSQQRQTTPRGKFRFEPGSYGRPESCMPSIACLRGGGDASEYHFVLVKPEAVLNSPDRANAIAAEDLNAAFSTNGSTGHDEALAMFLRERGYVRVDDFNVVDTQPGPAASWMDADGLHFMDPGHAPTLEQLDAASEVYQENIRKSPLWDEMVKEFGEERAGQLLSRCRVEKR